MPSKNVNNNVPPKKNGLLRISDPDGLFDRDEPSVDTQSPDITDNREQKITGTVHHIVYTSEADGFTVARFDRDNVKREKNIVICGALPYIRSGDDLTLYGEWTVHPRYGKQFNVTMFEQTMPEGNDAILRYLSSHAVKGIGPILAKRIVEQFGDDTFTVIEQHPDWLTQVNGVSAAKAEKISEDFINKTGIRNAIMFFGRYFSTPEVIRINKQYGAKSVELTRKNPYLTLSAVERIGFDKIDSFARSIGFTPDSEERVKSGICYALRVVCNRQGHTCLSPNQLISEATSLLKQGDMIEPMIDALLAEGRLVMREWNGEKRFYAPDTDQAEQYIVQKLTLLEKLCPAIIDDDIDIFVRKEQIESGITYADNQRKAVINALKHGIMLLTGGPGTGKTTIVRGLVHIFESQGLKVALAAPTGRAAKRMSESTLYPAKTIHRLLEMEFSGDSDNDSDTGDNRRDIFGRNEDNVLDENVFIIDEASMIDTPLFHALLKAIAPGSRLILIGDADQLPSIGPGRVLNDLLDAERFSTVRLTEVFRQASESLIITNAHAINQGEMPILSVRDKDFFFLTRNSDREIADTIVDLYHTRLPRTYKQAAEPGGVQIITPSKSGTAGTVQLNNLLQNVLNPRADGKAELTFHETVFRVGDRVMQIRNNYRAEPVNPDSLPSAKAENAGTRRRSSSVGRGILFLNEDDPTEFEDESEDVVAVFNGDMGEIIDIDRGSKTLFVRFDSSDPFDSTARTVKYTNDTMDDLEHAWAITVHKSQGSEYPYVIIPMYHAPALLLNRNLLYTAVTRATKAVILVGYVDVIREMVANVRHSTRNTGLVFRLKAD